MMMPNEKRAYSKLENQQKIIAAYSNSLGPYKLNSSFANGYQNTVNNEGHMTI